MKNMAIRKSALAIMFLSSALIFGACVNVHYEGERGGDPLTGDAPVGVYYEKSQIPVPESEYKVLGTATVTAPTASYTVAELMDKLVKSARSNGANGVLVISIDKVKDKAVRNDQLYNQRAPSWNVEDNTATAQDTFQNTMQYSSGKDSESTTYKFAVRAQFLSLPQDSVVDQEKIELKKSIMKPVSKQTPADSQEIKK